MKIIVDGAKETADYLNHLADNLETNVKNIARGSVKFGEKEASRRFAAAQYPGDNDVKVNRAEAGNEFTVNADGATVLFIEFGTGTRMSGAEYAAEYGFERGTYGKGKGENPPWVYVGTKGNSEATFELEKKDGSVIPNKYRTYGNVANKCMFFTGQDISYDIDERIEKEIGKW